jgi:hypothetical protein
LQGSEIELKRRGAEVAAKPEVNSPEWWAQHGVADEVRAARPYQRWAKGNLEPVRKAYADLTPSQQRTLLGWARQSDGLVIYRHSFECVAPDDARYVFPEIRPDEPVVTGTIWHYHGPPIDEPPRHPNTGNPLPAEDVHTPESMRQHIARDRDPDDHRSRNSRKVHAHRQFAKYLFPPSAKRELLWVHSHQLEYEERVLRRLHEQAEKAGPRRKSAEGGAQGRDMYERLGLEFATWLEQHYRRQPHDHLDSYLERHPDYRGLEEEFGFAAQHTHSLRVTLPGEQLAKRIDVNPLVWRRGGFESAERVFFGIEGCIKADAILTSLLESGQPPAVFSVPSVSLWEATYPAKGRGFAIAGAENDEQIDLGSELAAFTNRYLGNKLVCIVPDADAHTKSEVMTQALLCRSSLRRLGARAEIVLPPDDDLDEGIKGIDDYLGAGSGSLDGLVWYQKEPPPEEQLQTWLRNHSPAAGWRRDGMRRAIETLQALATHAGQNGDYTASIRVLSRALRRCKPPTKLQPEPQVAEPTDLRDAEAARRRFQRGIEDLLEIGAIHSNKPLNVRIEKWLRGRRGSHKQTGLHWAEDGIVITVHAELRARAELRSISEL